MKNLEQEHVDIFNHALQCYQSGRLSEAQTEYSRILEKHPDNSDALHMQLLLTFQVGDLATAADMIDKVLALESPNPKYQCNLGTILKELGRTDEAAQCYRRAIELKPNFCEAYFNLGVLMEAMNANKEATRNYRRSLKANSLYCPAWNNLGIVLTIMGNVQEGITCLEKALEIDPGFATALINLARTFYLQGDFQKAHRHCWRVLQVAPESYEALRVTSAVLLALGDIEAANAHLNRALSLKRDSHEMNADMGIVQIRQGHYRQALKSFRAAAAIDPHNLLYRQYISDCLEMIPAEAVDDSDLEEFEYCLSLEGIDASGAFKTACGHLTGSKHFLPWLSLAMERRYDKIYNAIHNKSLQSVLGDPLLLALMRNNTILSFKLEMLLTLARKSFLQLAVQSNRAYFEIPETQDFLFALARQCFLNEYVYSQSEEEIDWLAELESKAAKPERLTHVDCLTELLLLGSYKPLYTLDCVRRLLPKAKKNADDRLDTLIRYQIEEPRQERKISRRIPCLIPVTRAESLAVQAQYDENPYPRWLGVKRLPHLSFIQYLKLTIPGIQHLTLRLPERTSVLIAGCGSGHHAVSSATIHKNADILALDISRSSLAYGKRMARRYDMNHIRFVQGDLLDVPQLNQQFHVIECTGVLHHLIEPEAGLKALLQALHPEGLMLFGLYSRTARIDLSATKEWLRTRGYSPTPDDIRRSRWDLVFNSPHSRMKKPLAFRDFFNLSECRDLLFNVQEHHYTLPKVKKMLDENNLEFLGFLFQDQTLLRHYTNCFPEDPKAMSLDNWHRYETDNPSTFKNMYVFWVKKKCEDGKC
jgi:tetratricopeptide (TPR) repeat protein/SAM-dependent methyltransferase